VRLYRIEDGLVAHEEPPPIPGPEEALVRVKASALNFRDLFTIMGQSPERQSSGSMD
jgi:NADPH:quinone reductase-like Zn-dependent oxidoreductase